MSERPIFTYQTRIRITPEQAGALDAFAALYGKAERKLFADISSGVDSLKVKSDFMKEAGLSARQFNAVRVGLQGKIDSIKALKKDLIKDSEQRIKKLVARIKKLSPKPKKAIERAIRPVEISVAKTSKLESAEQRKKRLFKLHQAKRSLAMREARLIKLKADESKGITRLCFGSKKLFHAQFDLRANRFADHAAWKRKWVEQRNNQFFVLGSKDEMAGCQGCQAHADVDGTLGLQLRLPDAIGQHLHLSGIRFAYGQSQILVALASSARVASKGVCGKLAGKAIVKRTGTAMSYRFVRDAKGWRIFVSTQAPEIVITTLRSLGAVGVDLNADHLAVSQTDRFGNLVHTARVATATYGKSQHQAKAIYGDAAVSIARAARLLKKPVVIEKLDFRKKKLTLSKGGMCSPRKARMLSSFAYSQAACSIKAACYRFGVEVIEVNPAYTSVIEAVNHAQPKGISIHQGAAFAIARRGLGFSERLTARAGLAPARGGGHVTFELPARNRSEHEWTFWSGVRMNLNAAYAAHFRRAGHSVPAPPLSPHKRAVCVTGLITVQARDASGSNCGACDPLPDVPF